MITLLLCQLSIAAIKEKI